MADTEMKVVLDQDLPYVDVESKLITSEEPFNYLSFCNSSFKEDLLRSQHVKEEIYSLKDQAKSVLHEILHEDTTDKNRVVKADVAKWAMEKCIITTEMPKLSMIYSKSERETSSTTKQSDRPNQPIVSREELMEFMKDALEVEREIEENKEKIRQSKVIEGEVV